MEGLEISEIHLSGLERTKRIDAEFFRKEFLRNEKALLKTSSVPIAELVAVSDGNHFSISDEFTEDGIPYYRGQDITGQFFAEQSSPIGITRAAYEIPYMRRSHLKKGDVLLSIVGTVGSLALVGSNRDATCSCKLAIFRPKSIESEFLAIYLASKPGAAQIQRFRRGTVQTGFLLEDTDQVVIPQLSKKFTKAIVGKVAAARVALESAREAQEHAKNATVSALGLDSWEVPDPLTYECRLKTAFESGRLDAEFFRVKFDALRDKLAEESKLISLGDIGLVTSGKTVPYDENGTVPIVRSGDLNNLASHENLLRAKPYEDIFFLQKGDVLISSIGFGSIGKVQVFDLDLPCGAVSEVTVIRTDKINPYFLCSYLRSIAGQLQFERWTTGATGQLHLYPRDVRLIFVPQVSQREQLEIETFFRDSAASRAHSKSLLERAKRAVEIAIEVSEETALAYLDGKHYLADELLPKLFGPNRHYVDLPTVQRTIEAEALVYEDATINRYLHEWTRQGRIHDAGRGWYSDLRHPYLPNWQTPPLPELEKLLGTRFPLLEYTVWSTRQFTPFFHQYAARHATFLMVERDAMTSVADALMEAGHHVVIHPLGDAAKNFALTRDETIILRPRLSSDHKETHAPLEQMLVDFHHEIQKLGLFELGEFQRVFENVANFHRLNIPALKRYAERRKADSTELLKLGGIL